MVYAFFIGLSLGLPLGCYLREVGTAQKLQRAYNVFVPAPSANQADRFKSKSAEFYENIKKG